MTANGPVHIFVDLTKESLKLTICGRCFALVRQEDWDAHALWHKKAGA